MREGVYIYEVKFQRDYSARALFNVYCSRIRDITFPSVLAYVCFRVNMFPVFPRYVICVMLLGEEPWNIRDLR